MKPEDLVVGAQYWIVKYGNVYDAIFQGLVVGRSKNAQPGYIFLTEGTKVQILWPLDLAMVSSDLSQVHWHLHQHYVELADKHLKLAEKSLTNQQ